MSYQLNHHPGICKGGPRDGRQWDYHQPRCVVLAQPMSECGEYVYDPETKIWLWHPLVKR